MWFANRDTEIMSLSAEQIAARKGKMTGSRVGALMSGDVAKIDQL